MSNQNFKEYVTEVVTIDIGADFTEKEFEQEVDTTLYLLGRQIVDNSEMIDEINSYDLTKEEILKIREGLLYSFDNIFNLISTEADLIKKILES